MSTLRALIDRQRAWSFITGNARAAWVLAIVVGIVTWGDLVVRVIVPTFFGGHFPASAYWVAPRLVLDGRASLLYDVAAFPDAAQHMGAFGDVWVSDPPMSVLQLLPFGLLEQGVAYQVWTLDSLGALIVAVVLTVRALRFPLIVAVALLTRASRADPLSWLLLVASIALLAPPWPFNRAGVEGWWTLLFYPRVYGALLLWALLVWISMRRDRAEASS
ncbi:MAG: hypothetical protein ABIP53_01745 [Candidatus Limnocylindrales bacterium]